MDITKGVKIVDSKILQIGEIKHFYDVKYY